MVRLQILELFSYKLLIISVQAGIFYACTKKCFMQTISYMIILNKPTVMGSLRLKKQIKFMCQFSGEVKYTGYIIYFKR